MREVQTRVPGIQAVGMLELPKADLFRAWEHGLNLALLAQLQETPACPGSRSQEVFRGEVVEPWR